MAIARNPKTLGLIMDGNRRFARLKGLAPHTGHEIGYEKLKEFVEWARDAGVKTIIAYAFSTENWNRSKLEVSFLMRLLERVIIERADELKRKKIRVQFIGEIERFSRKLQNALKKLEEDTKHFSFTLVVALSYGGRAEILRAIKKISTEKTKADIARMKEDEVSHYLWTSGSPEPELILRTSGETRTSNFLPWQSAYSEWYFSKTLWPAFTKKEFLNIMKKYTERERRNGK